MHTLRVNERENVSVCATMFNDIVEYPPNIRNFFFPANGTTYALSMFLSRCARRITYIIFLVYDINMGIMRKYVCICLLSNHASCVYCSSSLLSLFSVFPMDYSSLCILGMVYSEREKKRRWRNEKWSQSSNDASRWTLKSILKLQHKRNKKKRRKKKGENRVEYILADKNNLRLHTRAFSSSDYFTTRVIISTTTIFDLDAIDVLKREELAVLRSRRYYTIDSILQLVRLADLFVRIILVKNKYFSKYSISL